jgi:DNA processing protein
MDLQTAVAASMLPTTRATVAAAFKDLRHDVSRGAPFLELLWAVAGRVDVLGPATVDGLLDSASQALQRAKTLDLEPIALFDPRYPPWLACTGSPPPVLWARGGPEYMERRIVAIVGSRAASSYAPQVAARLAGDLSERGIVIASGLARGVDSAAHRGCLEAGGQTIAVQGCGLDRVYPAEHAQLAEEITKNGLILSELAPGAAPLPEHFPLRNRIISGISLAVVIVEASERSGSLITARCALEQGRDVMAVPGSILSGRNRGSHALLKDGAKVVETADDILQGLGWCSDRSLDHSQDSSKLDPVLAQMDPGELYELDDLVCVSGMDSSKLLAVLTDLELRELVVASNGKFVRQARRRCE